MYTFRPPERFWEESDIGRVGWDGIAVVGDGGGISVSELTMRDRRRRKLEAASTGGTFLPSREI